MLDPFPTTTFVHKMRFLPLSPDFLFISLFYGFGFSPELQNNTLDIENLDVLEAKTEESEKAGSHRRSNPGHLWLCAVSGLLLKLQQTNAQDLRLRLLVSCLQSCSDLTDPNIGRRRLSMARAIESQPVSKISRQPNTVLDYAYFQLTKTDNIY